MATLEQLERALVGADKAGDMDAARRLVTAIKAERQRRDTGAGDIPEKFEEVVPGTTPQAPEATLGEKAQGLGEAALTAATGATSGTLGMIGGTASGITREMLSGEFGSQEAADRIEQSAMEGMQALTYAPRTQAGQEYVEVLGEAGEALTPLAPMAAEFGVIAQGARQSLPAARQAVQQRVQPVAQSVKKTTQAVRDALPGGDKSPEFGKGTAGAAQVDAGTVRQGKADELPVPIKLTEGQKTRTFEDQRFERETAKLPEEGAPLRERFTEQNQQLQQNLDAFIDSTGAQVQDLRGIGEAVKTAIKSRKAKDDAKVKSLYKKAEKAGELEAPVQTESLIQFLKESDTLNTPQLSGATIGLIKRELVRLGGAADVDGDLVPGELSIANMELLRKQINKAIDSAPDNKTNMSTGVQAKNIIDGITENAGGDIYKQARKAKAKVYRDYENAALIDQLITEKRGTTDYKIAFENVLNKVALSPSTSLDQMRQVRRLLQTKTGGKDGPGAQAWKEIQGGVLRHIRDQALKSVATDANGNRTVSPAQLDRVIQQLDKTGKLDFLFGKQGADKLRLVNEVAQDIMTSPPGAINHSNTATVLAGLVDVAVAGSTGIPAPIASGLKYISSKSKNAKLKAKVQKALGEK